jgi:hypothetical protein
MSTMAGDIHWIRLTQKSPAWFVEPDLHRKSELGAIATSRSRNFPQVGAVDGHFMMTPRLVAIAPSSDFA